MYGKFNFMESNTIRANLLDEIDKLYYQMNAEYIGKLINLEK